MKPTVCQMTTIIAFGLLASCDAVGVLQTNDPAKKLSYARLLLRDERPLPAERLINESMEIYQSRGDRRGLADAQYLYAKLLAGNAVALLESWYRENGFRDSTVTFEKRREGAVRYFQLAATGFVTAGDFADATNAYFDLGLIQSNDGHSESACRSFNESLRNFNIYLQTDPNPKVRPPKGYDSYKDLVETVATAAGCPDEGETE